MNAKQKHILKTLVTTNGLRYSELGKDFSIDDKYPYHLKYLLTQGLINKRDQRYFITKSGMKATTTFDRRTLKDISTATLLLGLVCQYNEYYYVKNHFESDPTRQSYCCIPTGQPIIGKTLEQSCSYELQRKYKMKSEFRYLATFHLTHYATDNDILFDTVHLAFHAHVSETDFFATKHTNRWYTKVEISKLPSISQLVNVLILDGGCGYIEDSFVYNYGFTEKDL